MSSASQWSKLTGVGDQNIKPVAPFLELSRSRPHAFQTGEIHDNELDGRTFAIAGESCHSSLPFLLATSSDEDLSASHTERFGCLQAESACATRDEHDFALQAAFCLQVLDDLGCCWTLVSWALRIFEPREVRPVWGCWCRHDRDKSPATLDARCPDEKKKGIKSHQLQSSSGERRPLT